MKNYIKVLLMALALSLSSVPTHQAQAQTGVLAVIQQGIKRVIRAVDLKIQRLQNKTIWLQNAQKTLENVLSKLKLKEIAEWTEKQKEQYRKYYEELSKVKAMISYYQRIREVAQKQVAMVAEYNRAWALIRSDGNFTAQELAYMEKVYSGILQASIQNIDQITLIIESFALQMSDAKRLQLINDAADKIDTTYDDLRRFNQQNMVLSLQRAKTAHEVAAVKRLYGLP